MMKKRDSVAPGRIVVSGALAVLLGASMLPGCVPSGSAEATEPPADAAAQQADEEKQAALERKREAYENALEEKRAARGEAAAAARAIGEEIRRRQEALQEIAFVGEGVVNHGDTNTSSATARSTSAARAAAEAAAAAADAISSAGEIEGFGGLGGAYSGGGYEPPEMTDKLTIDDILACKSRQELVDLLAPVYARYAQQYGLRYPGVFAVQTIYETLGGIGSGGSIANCARQDNNLAGLKFVGQAGATEGIVSSEGDHYAHFPTVEDYIAYCMKFVGTSQTHSDSRAAQNSMVDFTDVYVRRWFLGEGNEDVYPYYYENMLTDYVTYGMSRYEL